MQDDCTHILEEKNHVYNVTLNLTDLVSNANSYYILQVSLFALHAVLFLPFACVKIESGSEGEIGLA